MYSDIETVGSHLERQINHWQMAVERLQHFEELAPGAAWDQLEHYLGMVVRQSFNRELERLKNRCTQLGRQLKDVSSMDELTDCKESFAELKKNILRTEISIDFYTDAIASRTNSETGALLRGFDYLCRKSLEKLLAPLNKRVPPVLTYRDKGLGASILKAGLRMWNPNLINPAALIKVVHHNLPRPTSLIHESGHQAAYMVGWNEELSRTLEECLAPYGSRTARTWAGWASEIAADAFAFAHSGYGSVAALHDVLSGEDDYVFTYRPHDPHPTGYVRVLLGTEMCNYFYGSRGPWQALEQSWKSLYSLNNLLSEERELIESQLAPLRQVVEATFTRPMQAFQGEPLYKMVNPIEVRPDKLQELEYKGGASLYSSHYWLTEEALRILALTSYKLALPGNINRPAIEHQLGWMRSLGRLYYSAIE